MAKNTYLKLCLVWLSLLITAVAGCTSQSWYEGAKRGAENNCRNQPPGESERDSGIPNADEMLLKV